MSFFSSIAQHSHGLLRGEDRCCLETLEEKDRRSTLICLLLIFLGVGSYGASIGIWQGPIQACFVAIKLPWVILLTLLMNAILNGILASLSGVRLTFVQTTLALLSAFAVFGLIVGSLSPITFGMAVDAPAPNEQGGEETHRRLILAHTLLIAFAGIISTARLYRVLLHFAESAKAARHSLLGLLSGNLFAGAQVGFLLRPIFGQPGLKIEFLRPDLFRGNFYESVWWAFKYAL